MRHWHFDVDSTAHFKVDLVGSFEKIVKNRRLTAKIWKKFMLITWDVIFGFAKFQNYATDNVAAVICFFGGL